MPCLVTELQTAQPKGQNFPGLWNILWVAGVDLLQKAPQRHIESIKATQPPEGRKEGLLREPVPTIISDLTRETINHCIHKIPALLVL